MTHLPGGSKLQGWGLGADMQQAGFGLLPLFAHKETLYRLQDKEHRQACARQLEII